MSVNSTFDVDSVGGGYGGFGGFGGGNAFLWFLLLLADRGRGGLFGGSGEGAGAGFVAGETQSKLDCLAQQHAALSDKIDAQNTSSQFNVLNNQISELALISRDSTAAITAQNNDLSRQLADCCCDLKTGQLRTDNAIAMQTTALTAQGLENTQKILDAINDQNISALAATNADLRSQLNRREIVADVAALKAAHHGGGSSISNIDVNILRALAVAGSDGPGNS